MLVLEKNKIHFECRFKVYFRDSSYLKSIRSGSTNFESSPASDYAMFSLETSAWRWHTDGMQYLVELHRLIQLDDGYIVVVVPGIVLGMRDHLGHLAVDLLHV